jgi:hypothetical protein
MRRKVYGTFGVLVVAAIAVGVAVAYYGGSGSGTATAAAGHAPRTVTVTGALDAADSPLFPGQTGDVNIEVTLTGPGNARVGAVTATSIDTSNEPGCDPAWFAFTPPGAGQFPAGANVSAGSPLNVVGQLEFIESGTLQDACSDATVTINLQASPS